MKAFELTTESINNMVNRNGFEVSRDHVDLLGVKFVGVSKQYRNLIEQNEEIKNNTLNSIEELNSINEGGVKPLVSLTGLFFKKKIIVASIGVSLLIGGIVILKLKKMTNKSQELGSIPEVNNESSLIITSSQKSTPNIKSIITDIKEWIINQLT